MSIKEKTKDWMYLHYPWNTGCNCDSCKEEKERIKQHDEWRREYDKLIKNERKIK